MFKIIKSVSMQDDPVVIRTKFATQTFSPPVEEPENEQVKATNPLEVAELEANRIIMEAQTKASTCLEEANNEVEVITKQAKENGYQQGYEEGVKQGKQTAMEQMRQSLDDSVIKAERILKTAENESREMVLSAERQIIEIAIAIARKILAREIDENPMVILPIVTAAIAKVRDQEQIVIRVNHEDFDMVLQAKQDLQKMIGREQGLKVIADYAVDLGGCMIETPNGTVDARLDTQFEAIQQAIQGLLP